MNLPPALSTRVLLQPLRAGLATGQDNIADVDYRVTVSPGLGYFLMKEADASLSAEIGPGYLWEKVAGVEDDYASSGHGAILGGPCRLPSD